MTEEEKKASETEKLLYENGGPVFGNEWFILSLAGWDYAGTKGWQEKYRNSVAEKAASGEGVVSPRALTKQSLAVAALTASGFDASDVDGYDLLMPLADYNKVLQQGISGAAWALIALDSGNYEVPQAEKVEVQASREMYLNYILSRQTADGGFAFSGDAADPDMTAMVLLALAPYADTEPVSGVVEQAVSVLAQMQLPGGGYASYGVENAESTAQVILALTTLGLDPLQEPFVKNGNTMLMALETYRLGDGTYCHTLGGETDGMATEQALLALTALVRRQNGLPGLFCPSEEKK